MATTPGDSSTCRECARIVLANPAISSTVSPRTRIAVNSDAIWAGVGMVGAAVGGALLFQEPITLPMMIGIAVIAVGVTILASGQTAPH